MYECTLTIHVAKENSTKVLATLSTMEAMEKYFQIEGETQVQSLTEDILTRKFITIKSIMHLLPIPSMQNLGQRLQKFAADHEIGSVCLDYCSPDDIYFGNINIIDGRVNFAIPSVSPKWMDRLQDSIKAVENLHETFTHIGTGHLSGISRNCVSNIYSMLDSCRGDVHLSDLLVNIGEEVGYQLELFEKQNSSNAAPGKGTQKGDSQDHTAVASRES